MARTRRFKSDHAATVYHCITRTVNGEFLLDETAKEVLRKQLHQVAEFCGVQVITYAIMSNHFHVLVRVLPKQPLDDTELLRRYKVLYPKPTKYATAQIEILETTLKANGPEAETLRNQLLARMGNLSEFMKTLKQRFSVWYNRSHGRFGTLWAERFTSSIVEGTHPLALRTLAAYIDLNPVRAGLVGDPKDYRWCGYGEAVGCGGRMVQGLRFAVGAGLEHSDETVLSEYRMSLFGKGAVPKADGSRARQLSPEAASREFARQGKLSLSERLLTRVAWFVKGGVIGSRQFVEEHLGVYRERTRSRSKRGVVPLEREKGVSWGGLCALRGIREKSKKQTQIA